MALGKTRFMVYLLAVLVLVLAIWLLWEYYCRTQYDKLPFKGRLVKTSSFVVMVDMPGDDLNDGRQIKNTEKIAIAGEYEEWYYVRTRSGKEGWVNKMYVKGIVDSREIEKARLNMMKAIEEGKGKFR